VGGGMREGIRLYLTDRWGPHANRGPDLFPCWSFFPCWSWDVTLGLYFFELGLQMGFRGLNLQGMAGVALSFCASSDT
jgi:hypothetical protein